MRHAHLKRLVTATDSREGARRAQPQCISFRKPFDKWFDGFADQFLAIDVVGGQMGQPGRSRAHRRQRERFLCAERLDEQSNTLRFDDLIVILIILRYEGEHADGVLL